MFLLDLPLVLVQDIVEHVVRSSDCFPALELRRVNRKHFKCSVVDEHVDLTTIRPRVLRRTGNEILR